MLRRRVLLLGACATAGALWACGLGVTGTGGIGDGGAGPPTPDAAYDRPPASDGAREPNVGDSSSTDAMADGTEDAAFDSFTFDGGADATDYDGGCPSGLLHSWKGEGNADDTVGGLNGTWSGTPAYQTGQVGQAFWFVGSNSVQAPFAYTGSYSVDLWAKADPGSTVLYNSALSSATGSSLSNTFELCFDASNNYEVFEGSSASNFTILFGAASTSLFQHLAMTYDGAIVTTYLNGALASSQSAAAAGVSLDFQVINLGVSRVANHFSGLVDEVHVFGRVLSPREVMALYGAGSTGLCP